MSSLGCASRCVLRVVESVSVSTTQCVCVCVRTFLCSTVVNASICHMQSYYAQLYVYIAPLFAPPLPAHIAPPLPAHIAPPLPAHIAPPLPAPVNCRSTVSCEQVFERQSQKTAETLHTFSIISLMRLHTHHMSHVVGDTFS